MVIDTNIFIDHLRASDKANSVLSQISKHNRIFTTSVNIFELLIGATNKDKKEDVRKLIEGITVLIFNFESAKIASGLYLKLRSANQIIEFRDIFIAAICLNNKLPIKTLNQKHFNRIEGLEVL